MAARPQFDVDPNDAVYDAEFAVPQYSEELSERLRLSAAPRPRPPGQIPDVAARRAWLTHVRELPRDDHGAALVEQGPLLRLAARFRTRRVELGLTRDELAARSGVPTSTLRAFERRGQVALGTLYLLAIELGCAGDLDAVATRRRPDDPSVLARRVRLRRRGRAGTAASRPPR